MRRCGASSGMPLMSGEEFRKWVEANDKLHYDLMKEAGFLAAGK